MPANVVFGPTGIPSSNYDLAELRVGHVAAIPAGFVPTLGLRWRVELPPLLQPCSDAADGGVERELDPAKRAALFAGQADALMSADVPSIPLYSRPNPLIYKSAISGHEEQPGDRRLRLERRGVGLEVVSPDEDGLD